MDKIINSKAIVIALSLVPTLNGLGLVLAGKRTHKKDWMGFGLAYIAGEWVLVFLRVEVFLILAIALIAIIHTALICHKYVSLMQSEKTQNNLEVEETDANIGEHCVAATDACMEKGIQMSDIQIDIGSAMVQGTTRDELDIRITDNTGKLYTFKSKGNQIISFRVGASSEKTYLEV